MSPGGRKSVPDTRLAAIKDDKCDPEDISKKYDIRALNARLTDRKSAALDIPLSQGWWKIS